MKLGLLSSILDGWNYEEVIDICSEMSFKCTELASWPQGKAERRYAGVSHIDSERVLTDDEYASHILEYAKKKNVFISSLGYYPNVLDKNEEKSDALAKCADLEVLILHMPSNYKLRLENIL